MSTDELAHLYDPAKRREYYLKTRHLKGRNHAAVKMPAQHKSLAQKREERRKHLQAEITQLKTRLELLRKVLAEETKKAQIRSGVKQTPPTTKTSSSQHTKSEHRKPEKLTPAQKAAKAKAEKKRRQKDQTLEQQVKSLTERIHTLRKRIEEMRKKDNINAK